MARSGQSRPLKSNMFHASGCVQYERSTSLGRTGGSQRHLVAVLDAGHVGADVVALRAPWRRTRDRAAAASMASATVSKCAGSSGSMSCGNARGRAGTCSEATRRIPNSGCRGVVPSGSCRRRAAPSRCWFRPWRWPRSGGCRRPRRSARTMSRTGRAWRRSSCGGPGGRGGRPPRPRLAAAC